MSPGAPRSSHGTSRAAARAGRRPARPPSPLCRRRAGALARRRRRRRRSRRPHASRRARERPPPARSGPSARTTTAASTSRPRVEAAPERGSRPARPLRAGHDADGLERVERVRPLDDDDLVHGRLREAREDDGSRSRCFGRRTVSPPPPRARRRRPASGLGDGDRADDDRLRRLLLRVAELADPVDDVHALRDPADDRVLGGEVDAVGGHDEELAARRPRGLEPDFAIATVPFV